MLIREPIKKKYDNLHCTASPITIPPIKQHGHPLMINLKICRQSQSLSVVGSEASCHSTKEIEWALRWIRCMLSPPGIRVNERNFLCLILWSGHHILSLLHGIQLGTALFQFCSQ